MGFALARMHFKVRAARGQAHAKCQPSLTRLLLQKRDEAVMHMGQEQLTKCAAAIDLFYQAWCQLTEDSKKGILLEHNCTYDDEDNVR